MRTRYRNEGTHPNIGTIEYAWDKTSSPYKRVEVSRSSYDDQPAYYVLSPYSLCGDADLCVREEETITDDTGTDGQFRPCYHRFVQNEFACHTVPMRFYGTHRGNSYVRSIQPQDYTELKALRIAPNIDWDEMANEAVAFMVPRINEGTSLLNSLWELKDMKRMNPLPSLKRLQGRHTTLRTLSKDKAQRKQFAKEIATRMNDAHLNASFGIVPFLMDVFSIHDELIELVSKLTELKRNAGKRMQRHYKRVIPVSSGVFATREWSETSSLRQWYSNVRFDYRSGGTRTLLWVTKRARWVQRPVYHATMRYSYTLPEADSTHELAYAALDTLGVRLDPSIIWNAVRFSFIIDWVVDVSSFLQKTARDNYPINTTIHSFCHSYKWHREMEVAARLYNANDNTPWFLADPAYGPVLPEHNEALVSRHVETVYDRRLANPDYSSIRFRALKLRQAALAGSLLLARTRWGSMKKYQRDAVRPRNLTR